MEDEPELRLVRWSGPWDPDDRDANLKSDVALYSRVDPLRTISNLSQATGIPVGALVRYVLARWASAASEGLLAAGPSIIDRMEAAFRRAEATGTDEARLEAYRAVRQMVAWVRLAHDADGGDGSG